MAVVRSFNDVVPTLGQDVFLAETAAVIGDVVIGDRSSVWYSSVIRGDVFHIRVGAETSIQDGAILHVTGGRYPTLIGDRVTVGHSAIVHGCTVGDECIIGMGSTILDRAVIGTHCIVGAGALVTPGTQIPEGHLAVGAPARVKRELTDDELAWIKKSAAGYVDLASRYLAAAQPND